MDFGIHVNGEIMTECKCEICEQERQIMENIKAMFSEDLFNQTEKEDEMKDPQYTYKFTSSLTGNSGLARCICSNALQEGKLVKVFLLRYEGSETEVLDYASQDGTSLTYTRKYVERSKWDDVPVDAPVVVKAKKSKREFLRHFAKFENGKVWTWKDGCTSHTGVSLTDWPNSDFTVELVK